MSIDELAKVDELINEAQVMLKKQAEILGDVSRGLEQLSSDKQNALNNIFLLNGALQAYKNVQNLLNPKSEDLKSADADK